MPTTRETAPAWTDRTWDPVSPGMGLDEERLNQPFHWRKSGRVYVNGASDLFHPGVRDETIRRVFDVMEAGLNRRHTFQVLTRYPGRMQSFVLARQEAKQRYAAQFTDCPSEGMRNSPVAKHARARAEAPPANLWLGVPVEYQGDADVRVPALLETPPAVRFVYCAQLHGPVELHDYLVERRDVTYPHADAPDRAVIDGMERRGDQWVRVARLHWVVAGGATGRRVRPLHPAWARSLRDECDAAGVPYFFTQHGEYTSAAVEDDPKFAGGRA